MRGPLLLPAGFTEGKNQWGSRQESLQVAAVMWHECSGARDWLPAGERGCAGGHYSRSTGRLQLGGRECLDTKMLCVHVLWSMRSLRPSCNLPHQLGFACGKPTVKVTNDDHAMLYKYKLVAKHSDHDHVTGEVLGGPKLCTTPSLLSYDHWTSGY